jgi:hypothetical protein
MTCGKQCPKLSKCDILLGPIPPGPYITLKSSSQVAIIPRPPLLGVPVPRTNCPHLASGLLLWHDTATWGGSIPVWGQDVTIPVGKRVLIDRPVNQTIGTIIVPQTSELLFGSNAAGISLVTSGIVVYGSLTIGSETCRISTPVSITLTGRRTDVPRPNKGIVVEGGKLNLHGKRFSQTWTRLMQTVPAGSSVLLLQEQVNWRAGQKIVLVTSTMKDSRDFNQNEVHRIKHVIGNAGLYGVGSIVYLDRPVVHEHIANKYYQVEVGLLSRPIKIQGSPEDSEPTDLDDGSCRDPQDKESWTIYYNTSMPCTNQSITGFGGHIVVRNGGVGQVQGVELYRMGQTNILGRYPMHFHELKNCQTCYFRQSSVHRSYYRCVSIHGTHNVTVSENVAFDVTGYCYYLEDGVEEDNTISFNLAAHIHTIGPDMPRGWAQATNKYVANKNLILPADVTASGFYITNVHNNIIGNAASGVSTVQERIRLIVFFCLCLFGF